MAELPVPKAAQDASSSSTSKSVTDAVLLDAGPTIPIIKPDEFLQDFLPKVPNTEKAVGNIVSWIMNHSKQYAGGRWRRFRQDPSQYLQKEPVVFARLSDVFDAIVDAVEHCMPELSSDRTTDYVAKPTRPPETVFRYNLSRPDSYFMFLDKLSRDGTNPHWMDIAVAGEFKKKNNKENAEDNIRKVLWSMHHMLREDPRRRRCWGFTIENREFRMYSSTRSEIVVSRPVDFISAPKYIIRFFFAFMYASQEAMGCDTTMIPRWKGDPHIEPQYDIIVHTRADDKSPIVEKTFRTTKLISGIGAESIRGRGTRVWKVYEIKNGKVDKSKEYVLKDAWVDSDRKREGQVVEEIREDAESLADPDEKGDLLDCLLTTYAEGDVLLSDGSADRTIYGRDRRRFVKDNDDKFNLTPYSSPPEPPAAQPLSKAPSRSKKPTKTRGGTKRAAGDHREAADGGKGVRQAVVYDAKTHYRIVFVEVCEVLHEIPSLHVIVFMLWKACYGLKYLHKLGWVHRDISSGNIMKCGQSAKITDFEYAKKMTLPGKTHEIRTGTEDFMAIEVRAQEFSFHLIKETSVRMLTRIPPSRMLRLDDANIANLKSDPGKSHPSATSADRPASIFTWFYNPLHDFESIFWLMLYFTGFKDIVLGKRINCRSPFLLAQETDEQRNRRIVAHWNFGLSLFSGRQGREGVMIKDTKLRSHLQLHPLHPAIRPLADILCQLRDTLTQRYRVIEKNPPAITHLSGGDVADKFISLLGEAFIHLKSVPFELQLQSLRGAADALPKSYQRERIDRPELSVTESNSTTAGTKRGRDEKSNDERLSKSPRNSVEQKSPSSQPATSPLPPAPKTKTKLEQAAAAPARVLPPRACKASAGKASPPSRPAPPVRRATTVRVRTKGKATKNQEATKASAKIAKKAKNKTRKGR